MVFLNNYQEMFGEGKREPKLLFQPMPPQSLDKVKDLHRLPGNPRDAGDLKSHFTHARKSHSSPASFSGAPARSLS